MRVRTRVSDSERYRVVVADPAWQFGDSLGTRGAAANYTTSGIDSILNFKLPPLHDDAVLFLWRVAAMQDEALAVARAWGFVPNKGEIVWQKLTKNDKHHFGMGRIVRASHETCLLATRGRPERLNNSTRSTFSAKMPVDADGKYIHSAKPDEFFTLVRELYAGPRISLFERSPRAGFVCRGDEMLLLTAQTNSAENGVRSIPCKL
jgi:N6-adenosine-specific RNA methylase IME4